MKKIILDTTQKNIDLEKNQPAVLMIKKGIDGTQESFRQFLAGGVYLILNDATGRNGLADLVKSYFIESEWQAVKRQWNRRISACVTLAKYRSQALEGKQPAEILDWIKVNNIKACDILKMESVNKPPKTDANGGTPNTDGNGGTPNTDANGGTPSPIPYELKSVIEELELLKASEIRILKDYFKKQGFIFTLEKIKTQEKKEWKVA